MRPTRASPISSESMTTTVTVSLPATPVTRDVPAGRDSDAPAATSTRGLIIVPSAPVSSKSLAFVVPLILASTMIALPGVYLMAAPPFGAFGAPAAAPEPPGVVGAVVAAPGGALRSPMGTAFARYSCGRSEEHTSELQSLITISYAV